MENFAPMILENSINKCPALFVLNISHIWIIFYKYNDNNISSNYKLLHDWTYTVFNCSVSAH